MLQEVAHLLQEVAHLLQEVALRGTAEPNLSGATCNNR
jgi:hypothetical protein